MKKYLWVLLVLIGVTILATILYKPQDLNAKLELYTKQAIDNGEVSRIAVFIQPLDSGQSYGVNENDQFYLASLTKIPYLMSYLYVIEQKPESLDIKLEFTQQIADQHRGDNQYPPITDPMIVGQFYTIWNLLSRMIKVSDNNATLTLGIGAPINVIEQDLFLRLKTAPSSGPKAQDSPKTYSKYFLALYNATYLNKERSKQALDLLSETEYKKALVAGLPKNIRVAHKFGTVGKVNRDDSVIGLNDCGIVYAKNPYTICVMTEGRNYPDLERVIKDISEITYNFLKK